MVLAAAGPRLGGILSQVAVVEATPRLLRLAVPQARAAMARDHLEEITRLVQQTGVRGMSISLVESKPSSDAPASPEPSPVAAPVDAEDHPLVREALRVFDARVVRVEPRHDPRRP